LGFDAIWSFLLSYNDWATIFYESLLAKPKALRPVGGIAIANNDNFTLLGLLLALLRELHLNYKM
jgi:hypothetical protein